jgi:hypothetical protein
MTAGNAGRAKRYVIRREAVLLTGSTGSTLAGGGGEHLQQRRACPRSVHSTMVLDLLSQDPGISGLRLDESRITQPVARRMTVEDWKLIWTRRSQGAREPFRPSTTSSVVGFTIMAFPPPDVLDVRRARCARRGPVRCVSIAKRFAQAAGDWVYGEEAVSETLWYLGACIPRVGVPVGVR